MTGREVERIDAITAKKRGIKDGKCGREKLVRQ